MLKLTLVLLGETWSCLGEWHDSTPAPRPLSPRHKELHHREMGEEDCHRTDTPILHTNPPNSPFTPPPHPPSYILHTYMTRTLHTLKMSGWTVKHKQQHVPVSPWQHVYRIKCGTKTQSNKSAQRYRFVLKEHCLDIHMHTCTRMLTHIQKH